MQITAHCNFAAHGRLCRLRRTITASLHSQAQGRPGGLLLAWIDCAADYGSAIAHQTMGQKKFAHTQPQLNQAKRNAARDWAEGQPSLRACLDELERPRRPGEDKEPDGWA